MTCRSCGSHGVICKYNMEGQEAEYCYGCFVRVLVSFVMTENDYPDLTVKEVRDTLIAGLKTQRTF